MSDAVRTMISFPVGKTRFNYRVAAIVIRDGHVLVCREDDDDYVMLPGGRVEMGEPSPVALAREIGEELKTTGEIVQLAFTVENFFVHNGVEMHEIGVYYRVDLAPGFPFATDGIVFETEDEGLTLRFFWAPLAGDALNTVRLLPTWLPERLRGLPAPHEHFVLHEDRA